MDRLFAEFAVYCAKNNIVFFDDDSDQYTNQSGVVYKGLTLPLRGYSWEPVRYCR